MVKNPPANVGDLGSIPGLGRSPGEGNGHRLQYSCLENPVDRGGWWATVHGIRRESDMTEYSDTHTHTHIGNKPKKEIKNTHEYKVMLYDVFP